MNNNGYSMLDSKQLTLIYGNNSPYNNTNSLTLFKNMNSFNLHKLIENDIHKISQLKSFEIRQRDNIILSPISFTLFTGIINSSIILSPVIFSPLILAPSILGPVVSFKYC